MVLIPPDSTGNMWLIGISTQFTPPAGRLMIELPSQPGGDPQTGLWKRCVLKAWWAVPWKAEHIIEKLGTLPDELVGKAVEYVMTAVEEKKITKRTK
jgi:hypothetical protein